MEENMNEEKGESTFNENNHNNDEPEKGNCMDFEPVNIIVDLFIKCRKRR